MLSLLNDSLRVGLQLTSMFIIKVIIIIEVYKMSENTEKTNFTITVKIKEPKIRKAFNDPHKDINKYR